MAKKKNVTNEENLSENNLENLSEDAIQAKSFQWLWNSYPKTRYLCFSTPLGGLRTAREAMKLISTGAVAGTPDMIGLATRSFYQHKWYNHLYIEMKRPVGVISASQEASHAALTAAGNLVVICYSFEQFKQVLIEYIAGCELDLS